MASISITPQYGKNHQLALLLSFLMASYTFACSCKNSNKFSKKPTESTQTDKLVPTPQVKIKELTYDPVASSIICKLQNNENKPIELGKYKLKITRQVGSQVRIQGTTFNNKEEAYLPLAGQLLAPGDLSKACIIELGADKRPTLTFQLIYVGDRGEQAIGNSAHVTAAVAIQVELQNIQYDSATGMLSCTVANKSKAAIQHITIHWRCITDQVRILDDSSNSLQEVKIGDLHAVGAVANKQIGKLSFGRHKNAKIAFWLECEGDARRYAEQVAVFIPCSLRLVAEGPTFLWGSSKTFTCKVEQANKAESINFDKVEVDTKLRKTGSNNIHILGEGHTKFQKLSGTTLKDKIDHPTPITFTLQPDTTTPNVEFQVTLVYNGNLVDQLTYSWATNKSQGPFEAIEKGDIETLNEAIQNGFNINALGQRGDPPLTEAVQKNKLTAVKLLLEKGAHLNTSSNYELQFGSLRVSYTPLLAAVFLFQTPPADILELLVENANIDDIHAQNRWGNTLLHDAVIINNQYALKLLLEKGADKNRTNVRGQTVLQLAQALNSPAEIVALLQDP